MTLFVDNFWGEKSNGLEVLLTNLKLGGKATTEFADFLREFATIEENYVKWLSKVSRQISANSSFTGCTFSPIWGVYKQFVDKLVAMHTQLSNRYVDTAKQVTSYSEEQQRRTKQIRENEAATQEAVANFQLQSTALAKAREAYSARCAELDRARRDGVTQRDLDRLEAKLRKTCDEYRAVVDRYNVTRTEFERRHVEAARKFNEIDEQHVTSLSEFSNALLESLSLADTVYHEHVTQLRVQLSEMSGAARLLAAFVRSNATGRDRPAVAHFDISADCDTSRPQDTSISPAQSKDSLAKPQLQRELNASPAECGDPPNVSDFSRPSTADASAIPMPRSSSAALQVVRVDDSAANGEKGGKKEAAAGGSLANVAAAMSRGLMRRTNWVGSSIRPRGKLSVGSRLEIVQNGSATEMGEAPSTPSIRPETGAAGAPCTPGSAASERLTIDYGASPPSQLDTTRSDSESSSSSDEDGTDRAFRNLRVHIRPLESTDATPASADALRASVAELKLSADATILRKKSDTRRTSNSVLTSSENADRLNEKRLRRATETGAALADFVADFSQFEQRVAEQERSTPTPGWVAFGHDIGESAQSPNGGRLSLPPGTIAGVRHLGDRESRRSAQPDAPIAWTHISASDAPAGTAHHGREPSPVSNGSSGFANFANFDSYFHNSAAYCQPASSQQTTNRGSAADADATTRCSSQVGATGPFSVLADAAHSGKATPNSLEVAAVLVPPPLPAKAGRRSLASKLSGENDKTDLPTPPNSALSTGPVPTTVCEPPRPPPPARSRSAFGMAIGSPNALSRMVTPPVLEEARSLDQLPTAAVCHPQPNVLCQRSHAIELPRSTVNATVDSGSLGVDPFSPAVHSSLPHLFPFSVLITEKVHAKLRAAPRNSTVATSPLLKLSGVLSLSFSADVARGMQKTIGSSPLSLRLRLNGTAALDHIQINKTLVSQHDATRSEYEVNMDALVDCLTQLLQRSAAPDYVIDCVKFQCQSTTDGTQSRLRAPLEFNAYWRVDSTTTDYRLEYSFRPNAFAPTSASCTSRPVLGSLSFETKVSGGVLSIQPPTATIDHAKQMATWRVPDISDSEQRVLVTHWQLAGGPSVTAPTFAQFTCENSSLTDLDVESLVGTSFRLVNVHRSVVSGTYECEPTNEWQPFDAFAE